MSLFLTFIIGKAEFLHSTVFELRRLGQIFEECWGTADTWLLNTELRSDFQKVTCLCATYLVAVFIIHGSYC